MVQFSKSLRLGRGSTQTEFEPDCSRSYPTFQRFAGQIMQNCSTHTTVLGLWIIHLKRPLPSSLGFYFFGQLYTTMHQARKGLLRLSCHNRRKFQSCTVLGGRLQLCHSSQHGDCHC